MPKIIQHDVGQAFITGVTLRQHWPVNSHSLSFGAETAIRVAVIGLLTTEQTRVHLSHDLVGDQLARHHCFHFLLAFFGVVDIGLLIIEQTRVHLGHDHEHVHGGIHAQLVGQQPAQLWASPRLVHSGLAIDLLTSEQVLEHGGQDIDLLTTEQVLEHGRQDRDHSVAVSRWTKWRIYRFSLQEVAVKMCTAHAVTWAQSWGKYSGLEKLGNAAKDRTLYQNKRG